MLGFPGLRHCRRLIFSTVPLSLRRFEKTFYRFPPETSEDFLRCVINRFVVGSYPEITEPVGRILAHMLVYKIS
jgi:hypothetical protein